MTSQRTYLDHNATAPLRPQARAAMLAAMDEHGNPSSVHAEGRRARALVESTREQIAALVGARPSEVVFTSGATEANAWVVAANWDRVLAAGHEHASILAPAAVSASEFVPVGVRPDGVVELDSIRAALANASRDRRTLLTLQIANGETGAIQPVAEAVAFAREHGATFHTDAVQAVGRVAVDFASLGCDLMSVSAHKLGGPKGVGALIIRDGLDLPALILGGGQERRRRGGTEAVTLIAGFGAAAEAARASLADWDRIDGLRRRLEAGVRKATPRAVVVADDAHRLPGTVCLALPGEQSATLVIRLDLAGIAVSAGAACSSGKVGPSHVLEAMGVPPQVAASAIRVSLGWSSTDDDVTRFLSAWAALDERRAPARPTDTTDPALDRAGTAAR